MDERPTSIEENSVEIDYVLISNKLSRILTRPFNPLVIGFTSLKGGTGKSTLAQNVAVFMAHLEGLRICIVDTDVNQNSVSWYGVREDCLPDLTVVGITDAKALNKTIANLRNNYDIIIIDGTPTISEMATRIMMASDILVIPIRPGAHDFRTMDKFLERYNQAQELREGIPAYLVLNEYHEERNVHRGIADKIRDSYEIAIFRTTLKSRVAYQETSIMGMGVIEYHDLRARKEILELAVEILEEADKLSVMH